MKTLLLILSCSIFLAIACSSKSSRSEYWIGEKDIPGIVFLDGQLGMDQTEITNFNWLEFMYWTGRVYGQDSPEYQSILPDTTVWSKVDSAYIDLEKEYLRHPVFRDYPVVGVSFEQAKLFCDWRNDRVFEYLLIKKGYLNWQVDPTPEDYVSIDRFKKGEVTCLKPTTGINRFPHYRLPSKQEWDRTLSYLETQLFSMGKRQKEYINTNCKGYNTFADKSMPDHVSPSKIKHLKNWIFYLDRNLSEWMKDGETVAGHNWKSSAEGHENNNTYEINTPSALVGFRCAFEWK